MQVGTSSNSTVSSGTDYAFTSSFDDEGPRIAAFIDLPALSLTGIAASPLGSVVTGSCLTAEDFPRRCPQHDLFGFRRYERGVYKGIAPPEGSSIYPTRNFATLGIVVTAGFIEAGGQIISAWLPMSP